MAPLPRLYTAPFLPRILTTGLHLGVFALHSLFLYSDTPPPLSPPPIGSGNFEPNLYLFKYPNILVPVILPDDTTYEDGTDRVFRNVGT